MRAKTIVLGTLACVIVAIALTGEAMTINHFNSKIEALELRLETQEIRIAEQSRSLNNFVSLQMEYNMNSACKYTCELFQLECGDICEKK